jgi:O-acetyl-ADP-ribose deacetylase (regulator of RNase III)
VTARIELVQGDITEQSVDAIVNAANTALLPGGGVDGAITDAAGPDAFADRERVIRERGRTPLPTGEAVATIAGDLDARWIIHTAGPIYSGSARDAELLASCHRAALRVADELGAARSRSQRSDRHLWLPVDLAAPVAIAAVRDAETAVELVRFVLFSVTTSRSRQALAAPGAFGRSPPRW